MIDGFKRENFDYHGGYLTYRTVDDWSERAKFVARFKYGGGSGPFKTFLIKNFTVSEYFEKLDNNESPLTILKDRGYITPAVRKELKRRGYPVTIEGENKMFEDDMAEYRARGKA